MFTNYCGNGKGSPPDYRKPQTLYPCACRPSIYDGKRTNYLEYQSGYSIKGLCTFSWPIVVSGPCPQYTVVSSGKGQNCSRIASNKVGNLHQEGQSDQCSHKTGRHQSVFCLTHDKSLLLLDSALECIEHLRFLPTFNFSRFSENA